MTGERSELKQARGPEQNQTAFGRRLGRWINSHLGRGSYSSLQRWLDPGRVSSQSAYAQVVATFLGPEVSWLDAGCGHRILSFQSAAQEQEMASRVRCAVGCDLDFPALHRHRTLSARVCTDLGRLPFAEGTFDVVTLNYVAEHFANPTRAFTELGRVLAPGGRLVVLTPNSSSYYIKIIRFGKRLIPQAVVDRIIMYLEYREPDDVFPTYYRTNSVRALQDSMCAAGLTEESLTLMAEKPLFYFALPLSALELLVTKALMWLGWKQFAGVALIGVYRRPIEAVERKPFPL